LTLKGQEEYESYPEQRAHIYDQKLRKHVDPELESLPLYQAELRSVDRNGRKMRTRDMPSINAFPDFDLQKESKMYLTQLDKPTEEMIASVKERVRQVLKSFGPRSVNLPDRESAFKFGPSYYSDGHVTKSDFERPEFGWSSSWDYQKFKTDPRTEREVWLPNKMYKNCSSWWHFALEPIIDKIPYVVGNNTITEVRKDLFKRFVPCRKIDLKGFGLQFPQEYILACQDIFLEYYPDAEALDYRQLTEALFKKMSIKMGDLEYVKPKRGVGLGYFGNVMTLVVYAILQGCGVVKMFNDDILVDKNLFEKALKELTDHALVINEKKTGGEWIKSAYFAGTLMTNKGSLRFYEAQGEYAAIFNKRYHYERKSMINSLPWPSRWLASYHYERLFGYELQKCEAFLHPEMLGLDPSAPITQGYVRGGILRKYMTPPQPEDDTFRALWIATMPWKEKHDKKDFNKQRKQLKSKIHSIYYTEVDEYLNPRIEERGLKRASPDFHLGNYQFPRWADLRHLIGHGVTSGRVTHGNYPRRTAYHMLNYLHSKSPIESWITGGYEIVSFFYRTPGVSLQNALMYESLQRAHIEPFRSVNKQMGENAIVFMRDNAGLKFLQEVGIQEFTSVGEEFFVDVGSDIGEDDWLSDSDNFLEEEEYDAPLLEEDSDEDPVLNDSWE